MVCYVNGLLTPFTYALDNMKVYYIPIYLYMLNFTLPPGNIGQFFVLKKAQSCDYAKIPYYTGFWHCLYFIGWICSYSIVPRWRPKARLNKKQSNLSFLQSIYGRSNSFKALTHTNSVKNLHNGKWKRQKTISIPSKSVVTLFW